MVFETSPAFHGRQLRRAVIRDGKHRSRMASTRSSASTESGLRHRITVAVHRKPATIWCPRSVEQATRGTLRPSFRRRRIVMNVPDFFIQRWESEQAAFGKVLRAVPGDQLAYRPHERSTSAGDLAWQLAEEQRSMCDLLDHGEIRWETRPHPGSP